MSNAETNVLKTIIDALKPLTSEERQRTLEAALVFLGEQPDAAPATHNLTQRKMKPAEFGRGLRH